MPVQFPAPARGTIYFYCVGVSVNDKLVKTAIKKFNFWGL